MSLPNGNFFQLLDSPMRPGAVLWIGLRPVRRGPLLPVPSAELDPETGLQGDHYSNCGTRTRQVTLIAREALAAVAACLGLPDVPPGLIRRNVMTSGINLHALRARRIRLGSAELLVTGECHPCSRMEEALGAGGYNAMRGNGGITARIVQGGTVSVGDTVERLRAPA